MTAWPKTEFVFLRWTVAAMVVLCAWFAILGVREAISGSLIAGLIGLAIWLTIAVGLYRLMQWGRWLALAVLWLMVLFTLSPFGEMSTLAMINGEAPPLPIWHELVEMTRSRTPAKPALSNRNIEICQRVMPGNDVLISSVESGLAEASRPR
jgi:hypothetical protein